jgi:hypothetical protein
MWDLFPLADDVSVLYYGVLSAPLNCWGVEADGADKLLCCQAGRMPQSIGRGHTPPVACERGNCGIIGTIVHYNHQRHCQSELRRLVFK